MGTYWAYGTRKWDDEPEIMIVGVGNQGDRMFIDSDCDGRECEPTIEWDAITHWMGPLEEPEPPEVP
jgi:hypothetical protein